MTKVRGFTAYFGKKFSGSWRITKIRHEISNGGYTCSMTLNKNDHESKGTSSSSSKNSAPKASTGKSNQAKPAGSVKKSSSKPAKVTVNLN